MLIIESDLFADISSVRMKRDLSLKDTKRKVSFMAEAIYGDSINTIDAMLGFGMSAGMRETIVQEHQTFINKIDPQWGGDLIDRTRVLFDSFNGSGVMHMVQQALNHVSAISRPDAVFEFKSVEEFNTAQPVMMTYIMANPTVRKMYHARSCDGYSDVYVDPCPDVIGRGHSHYEHVMNGVIEFSKDAVNEGTFSNFSSAWASEGSEMLDISKKASMINTWSVNDRLFEEGDVDPTSQFGSSL